VTPSGANHRTQSSLESLTEDCRAQNSIKRLMEAAITDFRAKTYWLSQNTPPPHSSRTMEGAPAKLTPKITHPTPTWPSLAHPAPVNTFSTLCSTTGSPPQPQPSLACMPHADIIGHHHGGGTRYPSWPESMYAQRQSSRQKYSNTGPPQSSLKDHGFTHTPYEYCDTRGGVITSPCHINR
jgi:hypothetical protein